MTRYQDPWSVQIELTCGCTRLCKFCGLRAIRTRPYEDLRFMDTELAENIAKQLGAWFDHKRIEFALRGEPTLNPHLIEIISIFRTYFPKSQLLLSTNGDQIRKDLSMINKLFDAGLNILLIDGYNNDYYWWKKALTNVSYPVFDFFEDRPKVYSYKGYKHQEIILMDDISKSSGKSPIRRLNNQAGNAYCPELNIYPLRYPLKKRCSNPFREIVVFNNGHVPICCMDYREQFIIGKTPEQSLQEIWNSELYNAVRVLLFYKHRIFEPCSRCDYRGYKVGLLKQPNNLSLKEAIEILKNKDIKIKEEDILDV